MIYLWTATPGTGKTCYVVKQLVDNWLNDEKNKDRKIYANIEGLKIEGIAKPPDDFRQCEDGSIIIYDEAQEINHYSSEVRDDPVARALSKHRHRGFDIHFITQDPAYLNKWVLKNVFLHYYLDRPAQRATVDIYTFARAIVTPTKQDFKNAFDKKMWRFEKHYLKYYKSTVVNTSYKHSSQKKASIIMTAVILLAVLLFFMQPLLSIFKPPQTAQATTPTPTAQQSPQTTPQAPTDDDKGAGQGVEPTDKTPQEQEQERQQKRIYALYEQRTQKDYDIIRKEPNLQVRGVMIMGEKCTAYNAHGDVMTFTAEQCKQLMKNGGVYKSIQQSYNTSAVGGGAL